MGTNGANHRKAVGGDLTIEDCFNLLKESRAKLLNVLRNRYKGINYVWVLEPHETGYPHCHLIVFREFTDNKQNIIKQLWSEKYRAGSFGRGINITSKKSDESVHSIRNYLMKYMTKQFGTGDEPWTDGELLFNAMIWASCTRMWGASKELTARMRRTMKESDVSWDSVELVIPGARYTVWSRKEGTPFPTINNEPDTDDLSPEEDITKQFWKNLYQGIEHWRNESNKNSGKKNV